MNRQTMRPSVPKTFVKPFGYFGTRRSIDPVRVWSRTLREPDRALAVFEKAADDGVRAGWIVRECVVRPVTQTARGRNPQRSVACREQVSNNDVWQTLPMLRAERNKADSVESHQLGGRSEPQIAVLSLDNGVWAASEKAVLCPPRGMGVLRDALVGIDRLGRHWIEPHERENKPQASQHDQHLHITD